MFKFPKDASFALLESVEQNARLLEEIKALRQQLAEAKNDAERYQFLRTEWFREDDQNSWYMDTDTAFFDSPDDMDRSIDSHLEE